jgi:hypothetical protein
MLHADLVVHCGAQLLFFVIKIPTQANVGLSGALIQGHTLGFAFAGRTNGSGPTRTGPDY